MENKLTTEEKSRRVWELEVRIASLKQEQDNLKRELEKDLVDEHGNFYTYDDEFWEIRHRVGAVTTKFDESAFEKNEPEIYHQMFTKYSKTTTGKDNWTWTKHQKIVKG